MNRIINIISNPVNAKRVIASSVILWLLILIASKFINISGIGFSIFSFTVHIFPLNHMIILYALDSVGYFVIGAVIAFYVRDKAIHVSIFIFILEVISYIVLTSANPIAKQTIPPLQLLILYKMISASFLIVGPILKQSIRFLKTSASN